MDIGEEQDTIWIERIDDTPAVEEPAPRTAPQPAPERTPAPERDPVPA